MGKGGRAGEEHPPLSGEIVPQPSRRPPDSTGGDRCPSSIFYLAWALSQVKKHSPVRVRRRGEWVPVREPDTRSLPIPALRKAFLRRGRW